MNESTIIYYVLFLLREGKSTEAEAFKTAMGKLMVSLKAEDIESVIICLYSHGIISKFSRDKLLSPTPHHCALVRISNVLCHLETRITECPLVYGQLIEMFTNRLHRPSIAAILCKEVVSIAYESLS